MASEVKEQTREQIAPPRPVVVRPEDSFEGQVDLRGSSGIRLVVELPPEAATELEQLMRQTGESPTDIFRKALSLYRLAKEAAQAGKAVGVAENPDFLETSLV